MAMNDNLISGLLNLFLENVAFANVGNAGGLQPSSAAGLLYFSLHTADPGAGGSQNTNEVAYTGYARASLGRASGNFVVTGTQWALAAALNFPACTGGTATAAFAGIGFDLTGAGELYWSGAVTPNLSIASGLTPQLTTASYFTLA
jgi:hypothetical protein